MGRVLASQLRGPGTAQLQSHVMHEASPPPASSQGPWLPSFVAFLDEQQCGYPTSVADKPLRWLQRGWLPLYKDTITIRTAEQLPC